MQAQIEVIGAGLAGCEAAWRAANHGVKVRLWEMKPHKFSPAHKSEYLAELVCSNSLRASRPESAVGLLKEEMIKLDSIVMRAALKTQVPAGGALAVDRDLFSRMVSDLIYQHPLIELVKEELIDWPQSSNPIVLAAGPLCSEPLAKKAMELSGADNLHFYDALAPIIYTDSLDMSKIYQANRYQAENPGDSGDYLNCPLTREEFDLFLNALLAADEVEARSFEKAKFFEACLPIEVIAKRGPRTLTFGPMKPVGLENPLTGRRPYAVVQLRRENAAGTLWNMVGFQTRLTRPAQEKVFRLIPGLEQAQFARFGAIHRNTYLDAPKTLDKFQRFLNRPQIFAAGQISGVEGYVESAASGLWVGENAARAAMKKELITPPPSSAFGALLGHLQGDGKQKYFAPSNINFGLFPPPPDSIGKKQKNEWLLNNAHTEFKHFLESLSTN